MTSPLTLMPLLLLGALAHQGSDWSYSDGALNEVHWSKAYPTCGGKRQSPIDVQRKKVRYNPSLQALKMTGYEAHEGEFTITNTGHTVQISLPSTMRLTTNGTEYRAVQMHFHWNGAPFKFSGSEHTIDGIRYATEIHVVHYNSKYGTYERAKDAPDGLAVLAALVEVKDYVENTYYSNFISHLENVRYAGQSTVLSGLNIQNMLPQDLQHYYSYQGSLTTPPCTENVQWFLLAGFVPLSKAQIWTLENSLLGQRNHTIHDNYRTTQPRNDRVVEANFMPHPNHRSELQNYLHRIKSNLDFLRKYIEEKKVEEKYVKELAV